MKTVFLYVAPGPKSSGVNKDFSASQAVYVNTARALRGYFYAGPLPGLINVAKPINQLKSLTTRFGF